MRGILPAILGLVALSGAHARALPGNGPALEQLAAELDYTHLSDYPLDDVRNNGFAQRSPATASDLLGAGDESKRMLAIRVAAPPAAPRPATPPRPNPNSRPRPGQPDSEDLSDKPSMALERSALKDTSDFVKKLPCGHAKRSFELTELGNTLTKRMSGDEKVYTLQQWMDFYDEIGELMEVVAAERGYVLDRKLRVIWMGGMAGLTLGSRGPEGKTGDADISIPDGQDARLVDIFWEATRRFVQSNSQKFESITDRQGNTKQEPINAIWDEIAEKESPESRRILSRTSQQRGPASSHFEHIIGNWKMQLYSKMDRMAYMRAAKGGWKDKDVQDAKAFYQEVRKMPEFDGKDLTLADFQEMGDMLGPKHDAEAAAANVRLTLKAIAGDGMPGIAQELKDQVNKSGC
ncbi:hypothetical protein HBI06_111180 [Parastagonospora nodorum]|nr:hypothetical protein HBI06_111180 [Parastagonospora nodorum]KAH4247437.1 hypothetical protein HBI05_045270 [Parastagonospora nodorum]